MQTYNKCNVISIKLMVMLHQSTHWIWLTYAMHLTHKEHIALNDDVFTCLQKSFTNQSLHKQINISTDLM